jgi:phosphatidylserine/phosphatidylglycerophosphate/cardiolipin synthase-like enzyme
MSKETLETTTGIPLAIRLGRMSLTKLVLSSGLALVLFLPVPAVAQTPYNRLCDPAAENCRDPLLELIRKETVGIDVGFWFMEDLRYSTELIKKHQAGVPVRVVFDSQAFTEFNYVGSDEPVRRMAAAGIPMRDKTGGGGIFHFKTMIFVNEQVVEFSGANYSDEAFVPHVPYSDYVDEIIAFSDEPSIVNSFKRRFDDVWTDTTSFSNYANITGPLVRNYPTYAIDPELNFVPWNNYRSRIVPRYNAETVGIDVIMYRITDLAHTKAMIDAAARGVPVRLISEPQQYRSVGKLWHSYNIDKLYLAGLVQYPGLIQIKDRYHAGQNHEKLVLLRNQAMAVFGSSNWTSASAEGQHEHNLFTTRSWYFQQARDHFDRKWNNTGPAQESAPFVPLPPDTPVQKLPLDGAQNQAQTVVLKWYAGPWAHKYDVFLGTSPSELTRITNDVELGPSQSTSDHKQWTLTDLAPGTTYYWRVVGRTMANLSRTSATWSFRTAGGAAPPGAGGDDVVLWASKATSASNWSVVNDTTAAGGKRLSNPNAGAPKVSTAAENPTQFFEMAFNADAGRPYRLWIRGKATSNSYENDSVFVQFSDSVTSGGAPTYRIGTTSATVVMIEDCSGCGLMNWGWSDNGYGVGVFGPLVYFQTTGVHTIRVQVREDGLSIDQIILSPTTFLNSAPGQTLADSTIYAEQGGATLAPNAAPAISLTAPDNGSSFTAPASVTVSADASDTDGSVVRVDFFANGSLIGSDTTAPFAAVWAANGPNTYSLTAKAIDNRGAQTTSAARTVTINQGAVEPGAEVVRWASAATVAVGWTVTADATAAGGSRLQNPNAGAPKLGAPLENPTKYFELTFDALAGRPYRLWIRGKAISNSYENDSVYVQFSGSVTSSGTPTWRIGTTSATTVMIEDATNATISGWGWADNGYGTGVLGPVVYFAASGPQTIRIQAREDGLGIDQVVLSSVYYPTTSPGAINNDNTILAQTP